jgi:integrase
MASITKLPSGKYRAQVRRGGQYQGRTFTRKADAEVWARGIETASEQAAATGTIVIPRAITFGGTVEAYLKVVKINRAAHATLGAVCRVIGDTPLADLNAATLQRWIDQRHKDGVTGATINHNLGLIAGVLKWARYSRHLAVDVDITKHARASLAAAKVRTTSAERDRFVTDAEIEVMRRTFEAQGKLKLPMADLMDFALTSGMRLGEIVSITYEDLSHNERTILIRDRKDPKRKIGNHQRVPLSSTAMEIIDRQPTATGRIFPFARNSVSAAWIAARDLAGIDDVTFHDLRHRSITNFFARGLALQEVALISGHKSWSMLRRYTQVQAVSLVDRLG